MVEKMLHDVRYALRSMRKAPGFAAVAVLTLALGIGANTAIFTIVNAVFLHPLPVEDAAHLVQIDTTDVRNKPGAGGGGLGVSGPNLQDIRERAQSFSAVTAFTFTNVSMTVNGQADQYTSQLVAGNYFDTLGVKAALGRSFRKEEDAELGAGPVVVISHGLWERKFSADRNVIGKSVLLNGQGFTVIGVAPAGFDGTVVLGNTDMWTLFSMHDVLLAGFFKQNWNDRRFLDLTAVGRLKPGATLQQANAELGAIGHQLEHDFPTPNKGRSFDARPLLDNLIGPQLTRAAQVMMVVVGLVLLIACVNIANLLLARAAGRKREISIRLAVGASRTRIIAQLLTEAVVLAFAGGVLGLGLAIVGRDLLWAFRPPFLLNSTLDISLDSRVLLFTLGISIVTGILFGLVPALEASRPNLVEQLKERTASEFSGRSFGLRGAFVAVEFALSLVALIGAGLFVLSLRNAQQIDPGFNTENLAMMSFNVGTLNYDLPRQREFQRRVLEVAQATPGVKAATLAESVPLFGGGFARSIFPEGQDQDVKRSGVLASIDAVAPNYFSEMAIPIVRGEGFSDSLREDSPKVVVINQTAARQFWPNQEAVGKRFRFFGDKDWTQVVGVARDSKYFTLGEDPTPYIYEPLIQTPTPAVSLLVRTQQDPRLILNTLRGQVQALDRNLPLTNVWPIGEVISQALWGARFAAGLLGVFAGLAVVLASVGIYGVVAYSVGQRVREIGIRMALGARPGDVLLMILRQSGVALGIGLGAGLLFALAGARALTDLLYGVSPHEPLPFIIFSLVLALVGLAASYIPARRATRVDPLIALRYE
ncbi:MAG TPA: ABC transporter permease [Terriglobales bacterium]|nr:ABC transporter permease [Terriglobales bacterium]